MDVNIQLNNLMGQYKNIENQLGFLIVQSQNIGGLANIQSQIFNFAIQLFNMGIQTINIGMQMPGMRMDIMNYSNQIQNIGFQIQNLGNQMNKANLNINMMMPINNNMFNMGIQNNNMMFFNNINNNDDELNNGLKMNNVNSLENNEKHKKNIIFETTSGDTKLMVFDYGTPICDVLTKYLEKINKLEFKNKVSFIINGKKIRFDDKTKIESFFKDLPSPRITVYFH